MSNARNIKVLALVLLSILMDFGCGQAQISVPDHAWKILKNIQTFHYQPRALDDNFGLAVCDNAIDLLDNNGLYFTKEDVLDLQGKSKSIASDIQYKKTDFFDALVEVYQKRLTKVESLLNSYSSKTVVLKNETFILNQKTPYVAENDFAGKWDKVIKARILRAYCTESDSVELLLAPNSTQIEEHKTEILLVEKKRIQSKTENKSGIKEKVGEIYLKAIANSFDPHSDYFSIKDKEEFSNYLSKEIKAFGFTLEKNAADEFEIVEIAPGSAAWKSNVLNEEDVVLKAKSKGKTFSFENKSMAEVAAFLSEDKLNEAHFWVRKKNQEEIEFDLTKAAIEVEENLIESYILEGKEKIAYLYLPSFYSKGNGVFSYATGCANDVAKELIHLQKEGVTGLIFDLRSNGGGSMLESILLAGIFVDYGALSIFHNKGEDLETLKDINKGVLFDKPMVVLINQFSASASELFAAAMQDHNRALIVGSTSYGKSTAQSVYPINAFENGGMALQSQKNRKPLLRLLEEHFIV